MIWIRSLHGGACLAGSVLDHLLGSYLLGSYLDLCWPSGSVRSLPGSVGLGLEVIAEPLIAYNLDCLWRLVAFILSCHPLAYC